MMRQELRLALGDFDVDAVFVSSVPTIRWACSFTGSRALIVQKRNAAYFLSDARYTEQARREVQGADVITKSARFDDVVLEADLLQGVRSVLFQADHMTVSELEKWRTRFPSIQWVPATDFLSVAVAQKLPDEVEKLRRAQAVSDEVFEAVLSLIKPGMSEIEIAAEIICLHAQCGARRMSFEPIVVSGPRSALPHGRASARKIERGDVVLLDYGCYLDGFASDMTRTIAVGDPGSAVRQAYEAVREAQRRAIGGTVAGIPAREADAIARKVLVVAGYGDRFAHGLGHGIGLSVHEWPRLSPLSDDVVPANAAVTMEPGIYLPGQFGIRIEDTVVVREFGCERLGTTTRDLIVL